MVIYYYPDDDETQNSRDIIDRFEEDLINSFAGYLEKNYAVELEVEWKNVGDFDLIFDRVEEGSHGDFGLSTISITNERAERVNFTAPYLADIQVLVTNKDFKLANTSIQLGELLDNKSAITIPNTTLEKGLADLKSALGINYNVQYVSNTGELLDEIASNPTGFGYVDLINFLVSFRKLAQLKRQLFYPIRLQGVGMIYPKDSDWQPIIKEYFNSLQFELDEKNFTEKYFGVEIGGVINQIMKSTEFGLYEEIIISNREKEIQYQELLNTLARERKQHQNNDRLLIVLFIVGFIGTILLISYRIKSQANKVLMSQQEIIEDRNEELNKLNEEKNDLIRVLAHDLRSPLSNIQGCALMLGEDKNLDKNSQKLADIIHDGSNRIKSMISKILDVEAIESGDRNLQLEIISPSLVVQEIIYQNQDKARQKDIELIFREGEPLKVKADRFYLAQVLENLLLNALKFSNPGSKVIFEIKRHQEWIRIAIKDFGPGFTEEDKKKVFNKFATMSAKPTAGEESVGLGLSIVKKYTELMGGEIAFTSEEGEGTEFYIDLAAVQSSSMASSTSMTAP